MSIMKKTIAAATAAAILGAGMATTSTPAAARGWGAPVAAGVIGGLAAGAILGGALRPGYGYGYGGYGYGGYRNAGYAPAYGYDPVPVYNPCYRTQSPVYDPYGNFAGYRTVRVCN